MPYIQALTKPPCLISCGCGYMRHETYIYLIIYAAASGMRCIYSYIYAAACGLQASALSYSCLRP
jgi:hypothetical protein